MHGLTNIESNDEQWQDYDLYMQQFKKTIKTYTTIQTLPSTITLARVSTTQ